MISFKVESNIKLKMLKERDAETLFAIVDSNRLYLRNWLPWLDINLCPDDSLSFIKSTHSQYDESRGFMCGIYYFEELVGMCGYHPIDKLNHSVTIGYWLSESNQGKGIVTACVKFLIDYAFNELNLNKVLIPAAEHNLKSQAVSKRLGLFNEGVDRQAEFLYGRYVNHVRFTVLRSEWKNC